MTVGQCVLLAEPTLFACFHSICRHTKPPCVCVCVCARVVCALCAPSSHTLTGHTPLTNKMCMSVNLHCQNTHLYYLPPLSLTSSSLFDSCSPVHSLTYQLTPLPKCQIVHSLFPCIAIHTSHSILFCLCRVRGKYMWKLIALCKFSLSGFSLCVPCVCQVTV